MKFKIEDSFVNKMDFVSLMLVHFFGAAVLPHVLVVVSLVIQKRNLEAAVATSMAG